MMKKIILFTLSCAINLYPVIISAQTNTPNSKKSDKTYESYFDHFEIKAEKPIEKSLKSGQDILANYQDSMALVDLYNSTGGANWTINYGWLNEPLYSWYGIEVENNRVVLIELDDNNLSGAIPASIGNLTALTALDLSKNNLTGRIPPEIGNLINLEGNLYQNGILTVTFDHALNLEENNLDGPIPESIGNLVKLKDLRLGGNNLTGTIPAQLGYLNNLISLELNSNNLTGQIPPELGNIENLRALILGDNNLTGEIPEELGNPDSLISLSLAQNYLTGTIPPDLFYNGNLVAIALDQNDLDGPLPNAMSIPYFGFFTISSNNFYDLPLISLYPDLPFGLKPTVLLDSNNFIFSDLEQFASMEEGELKYSPQEKLKLEKKIENNTIELTMDAGGTSTTYQWYYDSVAISGATLKSIKVEPDKEVQKYHCEAKNSMLPDLTLIGGLPEEEQNCWEVGALVFCLEKGNWEKGEEEHKITTTNRVSVNNFLNFDGIMTIDTTALEITAVGEFYISDIPVPGGSIGKYTVGKGEYNLKLLGNDGKITDFLNASIEDSPDIFGVELKINDLQLVGGRNASGIKVGCSIKVPGIAGGCGDSDATTEIKLDGLEITYSGISLGGVEINDLGMYFDDYCLKNLTLNYDSQKDILISGAQLAFPFGEIGGGFKLEEGLIDSIAWNIEASTPPFVLGSTTIGIKGFFGHVSSITKPAMEIELGGIFSDILSDDLYRVTASGKTVWPTYFEVKGTGQFLRPVFDDLPFQLKGEVAMSYDIPNELLKLDFNGNFGTTDEETWLLQGDGVFKVYNRFDTPYFGGGLNGKLTLSEISADFPLSWVSAMFDFPVSLQSNNRFIYAENKLIYGTTVFESAGYGPYSLKYVVDLEKNPEDDDYLVFSLDIEKKSAILAKKSASVPSNVVETFTVPKNTEYVVFGITSENQVPTSILTAPGNKKYNSSSAADNILYSETRDGKQAFWSVFLPDAGSWSVELESPGQNDSVFSFIKALENEFDFQVNQNGKNVTITWDVNKVASDQTINILLDDNDEDFDGFLVAEGKANAGSLSFTLNEKYPDCNYYLFAQLVDDFEILQSYADEVINNPESSLAPPTDFNSGYNPENGEIEFSWKINTSNEIAGYILTISDDAGNDSVFAILNKDDNFISLFVEDYENKNARIESFNKDWKIGCAKILYKLTTNINDNFQIKEPINKLNIYPNPTTGNLTIRYFVENDSKCRIMVFDIQGIQVAQPLNEYRTAGFHQLDFEYDDYPNGIYLIKFLNNDESFTIKSILSK